MYRSAAPEWMTSKGWDDARASGVATIFDLRNEMERGRCQDHPVLRSHDMAGVTVVHAPTEDPDDEQFLAECGPWLDHPRSWTPNLRLFPDKITGVLAAIADASRPLLIHCAGGRDRTGMIGSMLLALADATPKSIVANYEAGFWGAALHRGHGYTFNPESTGFGASPTQPWTQGDLDTALADRQGLLLEWVEAFDVPTYLLDSGVSEKQLGRLQQLLLG